MSSLSGTPYPKQRTTCPDAWLGGHYGSMKLSEDREAVRVHVGRGVGAIGPAVPGTGLGAAGRWFVVGDFILTRSVLTASRPRSFGLSRVDWCRLKAGSIVNVGQRNLVYGHTGGEQVEWVSGLRPELAANFDVHEKDISDR